MDRMGEVYPTGCWLYTYRISAPPTPFSHPTCSNPDLGLGQDLSLITATGACAKRTSKIRAREGGQRQEKTSPREKPEDLNSRQQQDSSSREKQDLNTGDSKIWI